MSAQRDEPLIFEPGDRFRQFHYDIVRFLGAGFSGQVYEVRHRFTGLCFALKVSHLADHRDRTKVACHLTEAQASFCIRHFNVVEVIDIGCEDDGLVWQIMELLDGRSLGELLGRYGALSPIYAIDIALEVAWGLAAAHEIGLVHRDVQPSNVFLTARGRVKVLDFSLSSWVRAPLKTTQGRPPKGTLGFMAPEHIRSATANPQFDVYALGILLWMMLVGRHPFEEDLGNMGRLVLRQLNDEPQPLAVAAGLPPYVDDVVRRAVAKDPGRRYPAMWDFARDLLALRERLLADERAPLNVRYGEVWERETPILRGTESPVRYRSPRPVPPPAVPLLPSRRVYVNQGAALDETSPAMPVPPEKPRIAPTVPMAAVPGEMSSGPADAWVNRTPPGVTLPRAAVPGRMVWIGAAVAAPVLLGIGATVWMLRGSPEPGAGSAPPAAPSPSSMASPAPPRTSAPATPGATGDSRRVPAPTADPRRFSPSRPKR